jgi:SAM-dependent methyltransferase
LTTPEPAPELVPDPESDGESLGAGAGVRQIALQLTAVFIVASLVWPYSGFRNVNPPWPETAFAIGGVAFLIASLARQPWWWRVIHAAFVPLLWKIQTLGVAPVWYLLAFVALFVFYRGAPRGRIPLYFSNRATSAAVGKIIENIEHIEHIEHSENAPALRFIDLGAGVGSLVRPLARALPDARVTGIENAPAVWLLGFIRTRGIPNCRWRWGDFWKLALFDYDVVYAFLSPAPMAALWEKLRTEMRPGGVFISNSFAVPDLPPDEIVELDDARHTRLYLYQVSGVRRQETDQLGRLRRRSDETPPA